MFCDKLSVGAEPDGATATNEPAALFSGDELVTIDADGRTIVVGNAALPAAVPETLSADTVEVDDALSSD
jgi:hypothetical protein